MKVLINYASKIFKKSQRLNGRSGKRVGGFDRVIRYSRKDIDSDFYGTNRAILDEEKGDGYWLWKPYLIRKTMDQLASGDFLFYCDSGARFVRPIDPLVELSAETGQDLIVFELPYLERAWTKRDAFVLLECDEPRFADTKQRLASFNLWRKSDYTLDFLDEYLALCQDERLITDLDNQCGIPNYPDFEEHRYDQSILSLLTKKHGLRAFRDPSQLGNDQVEEHPDSQYLQLIDHTRMRSDLSSRVAEAMARSVWESGE